MMRSRIPATSMVNKMDGSPVETSSGKSQVERAQDVREWGIGGEACRVRKDRV